MKFSVYISLKTSGIRIAVSKKGNHPSSAISYDTIPKTRDREPASLWSEIPAGRTEYQVVDKNETARTRGVLDVDG